LATVATLVVLFLLIAGVFGIALSVNEAVRQRSLADARATQLRRAVYNLELSAIGGTWFSDPGRAATLLANEQSFPADLRDFTWRLYRRACKRDYLTLTGHDGPVYCVDCSTDGKLIVSGGQDGKLRVWEATSGRMIASLAAHQDWVLSVDFSPDGRRIASAGMDGKVRVWDLETRREILALEGHEDIVSEVAFSHSGTMIATAGHDKSVRLWDVATGRQHRTLLGQIRLFVSGTCGPANMHRPWPAMTFTMTGSCL
jgi:WD40 repeat protein